MHLDACEFEKNIYCFVNHSLYTANLLTSPLLIQALRLPIDHPTEALGCLPDLLAILTLLPYLGGVHDGALVVECCDRLMQTGALDKVDQVRGDMGWCGKYGAEHFLSLLKLHR